MLVFVSAEELPSLRKDSQFTGAQHTLEISKYSNKAVNHSNKAVIVFVRQFKP